MAADGYVIEVRSPPDTLGEQTKQVWYAHIHERSRAIRALRKAACAGLQSAVDVIWTEKHRILRERLAILSCPFRFLGSAVFFPGHLRGSDAQRAARVFDPQVW
jgi:hypothetical protein